MMIDFPDLAPARYERLRCWKLLSRIRTMAEGTKYEEKALGYIEGANGDTLELVQVAEALSGALASA